MRPLPLWLLCLVVAFAATASRAEATPAAAAADWIAGNCTGAGGTLRVRPRGEYVSGYFGTITAQGLVASRSHLDIVRSWMAWYVANAHGSGSGIDGVPDDVRLLPDGGSLSRGRPDSTDAYGATFLSLALAAYHTGDPSLRAFVLSHESDLKRIAASIYATQQSNGLTWSRPQHKIAYAIDNQQVYRGLIDAAALFEEAFGDHTYAQMLATRAAAALGGMENILWDLVNQTYRPSVGTSFTGAPADLTRAYPDALAQVTAIIYGVVDPSSLRASTLLARASAALLEPTEGDANEYRNVVALADIMAHKPAAIGPFTPPPICVDAGWYLLVQSQQAHN